MNINKKLIKDNVFIITLENDNGVIVELLTYGACLKSFSIPYKGKRRTITQSFVDINEYIKNNTAYCGKILGPNAGRINSTVGIDLKNGTILHPDVNERGVNNLHGGNNSVSTKNWEVLSNSFDNYKAEVVFTTSQKDGEDGYSGNRKYKVIYTLDNKNNLVIDLNATSDSDTYINMSSHAYWNLNGNSEEGLDQRFKVNAVSLAFNAEKDGVPEKSVILSKVEKENNISFSNNTKIKDLQVKDINTEYAKQIKRSNGLNSGFIFKEHDIDDVLCILTNKEKDIILETYSNAPAMVAYSSGSMDEGKELENNQISKKSCSIALEFQELPSIQKPTILKANKQFNRKIIFKINF